MSQVPSLIRDLCSLLSLNPAHCCTVTSSGGFDQESHSTLEVNFPLGPLPELQHFCKIRTNQYSCKETESPLRLLTGSSPMMAKGAMLGRASWVPGSLKAGHTKSASLLQVGL